LQTPCNWLNTGFAGRQHWKECACTFFPIRCPATKLVFTTSQRVGRRCWQVTHHSFMSCMKFCLARHPDRKSVCGALTLLALHGKPAMYIVHRMAIHTGHTKTCRDRIAGPTTLGCTSCRCLQACVLAIPSPHTCPVSVTLGLAIFSMHPACVMPKNWPSPDGARKICYN